jgi:hypothetical protein
MSNFLKYFWIDKGDEKKDIYIELSSEEGKQGQKGGRFVITMACDSPNGLKEFLGLSKAPTDGIVKLSYKSLEEGENHFDNIYKAATNKSDVVIG